MILAQPQIRLEVKDSEGWFGPKFPEGVDELHFLGRRESADGRGCGRGVPGTLGVWDVSMR